MYHPRCWPLRLALATVAVATVAFAAVAVAQRKLTPQEIDERAQAADAEIWHMGPGVLEERITEGSWLVFFGARLTPRWHYMQQKYLEEDLIEKDFYISKVDCTEDEDWCAKFKVDSYPTLYLYHRGELVEEYMGEHEPEPILEYVRSKAALYATAATPPTASSAEEGEGEGSDAAAPTQGAGAAREEL
ncbi:hypothetical protein HK405_003540 [Cladochytrium tenue]|nr:hypothetical protein HK405_003540 [Cladochytrium tenue]